MSAQPFSSGRIPEWTQGDYLRKARVSAGLTVKELAARTGISEKTINNYEADRHQPRRPSLIAWALATGVQLKWLEMVRVERPSPHPDGGLVGEAAGADSGDTPPYPLRGISCGVAA